MSEIRDGIREIPQELGDVLQAAMVFVAAYSADQKARRGEARFGPNTEKRLLAAKAKLANVLFGHLPIPNGWKLVPEEPTEAMLSAPKMREYAWVSGDAVDGWDIARCWEEMLEASPPPPIGKAALPAEGNDQ